MPPKRELLYSAAFALALLSGVEFGLWALHITDVMNIYLALGELLAAGVLYWLSRR